MPNITDVYLPDAFRNDFVNNLNITGSTHFTPLSRIDIGALQRYIGYREMWSCTPVDGFIEELVIHNECNANKITVLDLSKYLNLKNVVIGDGSFVYVNEVSIIGLSELESVVIGMNSFTQHKNDYGNDPNRHFYLKNCPKLKSLKIGRYSFKDYTVCAIENVDALEMIEIGDLNDNSYNFAYASLELKSILIHSE